MIKKKKRGDRPVDHYFCQYCKVVSEKDKFNATNTDFLPFFGPQHNVFMRKYNTCEFVRNREIHFWGLFQLLSLVFAQSANLYYDRKDIQWLTVKDIRK